MNIPGEPLLFDQVYSRVDISYRDKAEEIYQDIVKYANPKDMYITTINLPKNNFKAKCYILVEENIRKLYPKVYVGFASTKELSKNNRLAVFMSGAQPKLLWTFQKSPDSQFLIVGMDSPKGSLTKDYIIKNLRDPKIHAFFIHELTHYIQHNKRIYFESPFKNQNDNYFTVRHEREAYISEFIHSLDNNVFKNNTKSLKDFDSFLGALLDYLNDPESREDKEKYAAIIMNLSKSDQTHLTKDIYQYFLKRYKDKL